jgi:hypothetical protein
MHDKTTKEGILFYAANRGLPASVKLPRAMSMTQRRDTATAPVGCLRTSSTSLYAKNY